MSDKHVIAEKLTIVAAPNCLETLALSVSAFASLPSFAFSCRADKTCKMPVGVSFDKRWRGFVAFCDSERTSCREAAALGRVGRTWQITAQYNTLALPLGDWVRQWNG
jgi:hypothetical protein